MASLNEAYANGTLHPDLAFAIEHSNAKPNAARFGKLSLDTVKKWPGLAKKRGSMASRKTREKTSFLELPWLPYFLARYRVPARPKQREAWRQMVADLKALGWEGSAIPSQDAMYRMADRLPVPLLEKGRATGAAWKALRPCIRRDWSGLKSNEVWIGDGHTFKAKVQHPDHGRPFAPEVTLIIDAASRYVVGWTVSLAENCIAVAEALGHGMARHGKPLIYYSDNGAGQTAKLLDAPVTGLLARLGVHHETGIPGNPQGRGLIERLWQTLTIPLARTFPTCQTRTMDRETLNKTARAIQSALKKGEVPNYVPTWKQFMDALEEAIEDYNAHHAHRALGGRTPAEVYRNLLDPLSAMPLSAEEIVGLYRPEVQRTTARGEVRLFNNRYYLPSLADFKPGTPVRVAYDIHDAGQVWVKAMDGRLLGVAEWDGNKRDGFAKPFIEQLREQRRDGRVQRAETRIEEAEAELRKTLDVIPETPLPLDLQQTILRMERRAHEIEPTEALSVGGAMPQPAERRIDPEPPAQAVVEMDDTPARRLARWRALDERRAAGEALTPEEYERWRLYQRSKEFAQKRREEAGPAADDYGQEAAPWRTNAYGA